MERVSIFGVKIFNINLQDTTKLLNAYLKGNKLNKIYTPNTEIVMAAKNDSQIKEILNRGDLLIPDGIGLVYGSRIKGKPLKERVTGYDISIKLLETANQNKYSLFLLGGEVGIAKMAAEKISKEYPNIEILGYHHGYFKGSHLGIQDSREENEIIHEINMKNPDIIFVGLGFPRQEIWIDRNAHRLNARIAIGNGGVMDILAGKSKRAPEIYQKLGLEWLYRLLKEPSRIKRQLAIPKFIFNIIFNKDVVK